MSILNVNQIQPVGGGNTITVSASDVNFSGNISIGSSFVGTASTANLATSAQGLTGTPDITVRNIQSGVVTATTFIGNGSGLTGVTASGSGINIKDSGSTVGVAATVDFSTNLNVSPAAAGIVTVTVGDTDFSIADKIVHTGDTNTAIRFPAADTFTVETAGSERLRIDSAGSVIIGDSDTDNANAIANDLVVGNTSQRSGITIVSGSGDDGNIFFSDGTGTNQVKGQIVYNQTADAMRFYTANAQRIGITSTGRIGINQASPEAMLQVDYDEGSSEVGLRLRAYNASGSKTWQLSEINGNAGVFTIRNATNSQDILNIDGANQRVGVNDTTPDATLSVGGSTAFIDVGAAGGNRGKIGYSSNDLYFGTSSSSGEFIFKNNVTSTDNPASSGTERLRVDSSGRLLVGHTSSVSSLADVKIEAVSGAGAEIHLARNDSSVTDGNGIGILRFYGNDGGTYQECARINCQADGTHADGDKPSRLTFYTTPSGAQTSTERLRITSAEGLFINNLNNGTGNSLILSNDSGTWF